MVAINWLKAEMLNIDGSVMGSGLIMVQDRELRKALFATFGEPGYQVETGLPVGPKGDARCPYQIRLTVE